ncbi:MAG: NUDIX hydrolase [Defluviitaleaceae bacterium]|nr:NUDIX hydrolase [Defluviitaleaceae bacterium]
MDLIKRITFGEIFADDEKQQKSARVVLMDDNNLVAVLYLGALDFYTLPGGGVDDWESYEQGAIREVREETGCNCEIVNTLGRIDENSKTLGWNGVNICFIAKVKGEKGVCDMTQEEIDDKTQLHWYSLDEALEIIANQQANPTDEREAGILKIIQQRNIVILNCAKEILG